MAVSSPPFITFSVSKWTRWANAQSPLTPQGVLLLEKLLATLKRCAKKQRDMKEGLDSDRRDEYGQQQTHKIYEKLVACLEMEAKYAHLILPFQRLQCERLLWIYGIYLEPHVKDHIRSSIPASWDGQYREFLVWERLFEQRREARNSPLEQEGLCGEKQQDAVSEMLRSLTYLIGAEPCEKLYNALERWVLDSEVGVGTTGGQKRQLHTADADLVLKDYSSCSKVLSDADMSHVTALRWAVERYCSNKRE